MNPFTDVVAQEVVHAARRDALGDPHRATRSRVDNQIEEAIAFMRQSAAVQMERIQTILDGATLAAEQVQDKRIDLLEQGPEVSGTDIFIEFALTFILESPLAGKALTELTKAILKPRLQARALGKEVQLYLTASRSGRSIKRPAARALKLQGDALRRELAGLHEDMARIGTGEWREWTIGGAKGVRAAAPPLGKGGMKTDPSDTPGVAILSLSQTYAANQRLSLEVELIIYESWARQRLITPSQLMSVWSWEELPTDFHAIRNSYARCFELLIWTMLMDRQAKQYGTGITGKSVTMPLQVFANLDYHVPNSLLNYWLRRFVNPKTGASFAATPALPRPGGKPLDRSVAALSLHMKALAEQFTDKPALVIAGTFKEKS